jgi:hypothetical protein
MKLLFFSQIFKKSSNINLINMRPVRAEMFHADGHDEANSRFSLFCERT